MRAGLTAYGGLPLMTEQDHRMMQGHIMSKWQWILQQFWGRLWVRVSLFCVAAILSALFALVVKDYIPESLPELLGADAVDGILTIIANSMLAVTTFSLSIMVAAYSAATNNVTPRSTKLLLRDNTSQNALAVFIGAFLYSLVGIVALSMGIYGDNGRFVLFIMTVLVIAIIVATMVRWIDYLSRLGRVGETIDMVEKATREAIAIRLKHPFLGGVAHKGKPPKNSHALCHYSIGYVQHVDVPALSRQATELEAEFYIERLPGALNDSQIPVLYSTKKLDEEQAKKAREAFTIGDSRNFQQDPRFGLIVLSEIASRALSPAVNDPGTAIDIIGTAVRVLAPWVAHKEPAPKPEYPLIHVPMVSTADMFDDTFTGVARDGAGMVEVCIRLQKALNSLAEMGDAETKKQAKRLSATALEYANDKLPLKSEKALVAKLSL